MSAPVLKLRAVDLDRQSALAREARIPPLIAQLLLLRGVTTAAAAHAFLNPRRDGLLDPSELPGCVEAAERLARAIRDDRSIVIYGDYDVDGVCGTSILWDCLRLAGARRVEYYIPHRIDEGYGLNAEALRHLKEERGAETVVTVDCGVSAIKEAAAARGLGLELIITDHHTPGAEWPAADVVVHPRAPGSAYGFPDLCGAAVAFKVAWQLCKTFGDGKRASPHLRDFLVNAMNYVALATIADVVPLEGENRIFVKHGLVGISRAPSVGLRALLEVSGCAGKNKLSSGTIGFGIAPRINAAGRMERARIAVDLLTTIDPERAGEFARVLDECNARRQGIERQIVQSAHAQIDEQGGLGERGAIVLGSKEWHAGVIGIVASRMVDAYHRPTIILAMQDDLAQGSARSIPGFDLHHALCECSEGLLAYGGHKAAAGLKLHPSELPRFAERFDAYCRAHLAPEMKQRTLWIDAEAPLAMWTHELVDQVDALEPYGMGNPRPLFLAEPVRILGEVRAVGQDGIHAQLRLSQGPASLRAVAWNMAKRLREFDTSLEYSVAFQPQMNEWNGRREVQVEVKDIRPFEGRGSRGTE